jgi:hypothetical protein
MATQEPIEITVLVAAILERLGVEYLIGGSLATSLHGIPCDARRGHRRGLATSTASTVQDAIRRQRSFNILHLAMGSFSDIIGDSYACYRT